MVSRTLTGWKGWAALQTLSEIRAMLESRGLSPRKSLGQNFLHDHNLIRRLVDESGATAGDLVLEVGPGTGALTEALLERGCEVVACEKDDQLAQLLAERFGGMKNSACPGSSDQATASEQKRKAGDARPGSESERTDPKTGQWHGQQSTESTTGRSHGSFTLIHGDCLASKQALNPTIASAVRDRPFTMVANLPYHAASPLMIILATQFPNCAGQYVTIQKEVAERVRAQPGSRDYSELSVLIQAMCTVRRIATAPPECFWPRPKVTSEMIAIERREAPLTNDVEALSRLCRTLFTKRRKQLGSILGRDINWPDGVHPEMRPEALTIEQMVKLVSVAGT